MATEEGNIMKATRPLWLAPLVLAASLTGASAQEEQVTADTVLATVNGVDITAGHLALMRGQLPQQYQSLPLPTLYEGLLQQAISQSLLAQSVDDIGRLAELALENEARALRANIAMRDLGEAALTEEALQAAYQETYGSAEPTTEFNAAHILVETEARAGELKAELDGGADFAALAREHSTGPSGPNGGDLGWFGPGAMVPEFEAAVAELEPGEVSEPVQTQFGWHLVKLNDVRQQDVPAFADVREELAQAIRQEAVELRLAELRSEADLSQTGPDEVAVEFLADPSILED